MSGVSNEKDRRVFSILSRGKRQRIEIIKLLEEWEGITEHAADNRLKKLPDYYPEIEREETERGVYYYRTDVGKELTQFKPYANKNQVNQLFTGLENGLGMKNSEQKVGSTHSDKPRIILLSELLKLSTNNKFVLHEREVRERYLEILNEYVGRLEEQYGGDRDSNKESNELQQKSDLLEEYQLLFQLSKELLSNAKNGHEPIEIVPEMHEHLDNLEPLVPNLPVQIGLEVQELAREVFEERGKEFFKQILALQKYDIEVLKRQAFFTYDIHHDLDEMLSDISDVTHSESDENTKKRLQNLKKDVTNLTVQSRVSSNKENR